MSHTLVRQVVIFHIALVFALVFHVIANNAGS